MVAESEVRRLNPLDVEKGFEASFCGVRELRMPNVHQQHHPVGLTVVANAVLVTAVEYQWQALFVDFGCAAYRDAGFSMGHNDGQMNAKFRVAGAWSEKKKQRLQDAYVLVSHGSAHSGGRNETYCDVE